jgi:hypothetical protein
MVKFPMTDVFPFTLLYPPQCFVEHTVFQGCVNRAIAYILGILCTEGTNAVCGDGGFWCGSSNAIPYSLFLDFDHANPTVHVALNQTRVQARVTEAGMCKRVCEVTASLAP